jgi:serine protease DegQ
VITQVEADSAAEKAGLQPGDVITQLNGTDIESSADLRNKVGLVPIGQQVTLTAFRDGKRIQVTATVGEATAQSNAGPGGPSQTVDKLQGAELRNLGPTDPQYGQVQGAVVSGIEQGSPAARNGLRAGDIITAVNRTRVTNVQELRAAMQAATGTVALNVIRGNARLFIVIP